MPLLPLAIAGSNSLHYPMDWRLTDSKRGCSSWKSCSPGNWRWYADNLRLSQLKRGLGKWLRNWACSTWPLQRSSSKNIYQDEPYFQNLAEPGVKSSLVSHREVKELGGRRSKDSSDTVEPFFSFESSQISGVNHKTPTYLPINPRERNQHLLTDLRRRNRSTRNGGKKNWNVSIAHITTKRTIIVSSSQAMISLLSRTRFLIRLRPNANPQVQPHLSTRVLLELKRVKLIILSDYVF